MKIKTTTPLDVKNATYGTLVCQQGSLIARRTTKCLRPKSSVDYTLPTLGTAPQACPFLADPFPMPTGVNFGIDSYTSHIACANFGGSTSVQYDSQFLAPSYNNTANVGTCVLYADVPNFTHQRVWFSNAHCTGTPTLDTFPTLRIQIDLISGFINASASAVGTMFNFTLPNTPPYSIPTGTSFANQLASDPSTALWISAITINWL